ncbi:MAG: SPOR domain-containing protein [Sphingomonadaceae bacterium]
MIARSLVALSVLIATPAMASVSSGVQKWRAGDWAGAVADWVQPAARGDVDALFNLGQAYRLGRGVQQNQDVALDYYRRAAAKGHLAATANLGITLYQDGRKTEALQHLRDAADKGDLRAGYVLGVATFTGDGAPRNPTLGYAYVLRSRDGGLEAASAQAARMATLLTANERARGEAAAAALAAGEPVPVELVGGQARPAPATTAPAPAAPPPVNDASEATAAASAAENTRTPAPEGWKVQLGAYTSDQAARTAWATLVANSGDLLKGQKPLYQSGGRLVRLQVGPLAGREEARQLCQKLSASGRPCFVTQN